MTANTTTRREFVRAGLALGAVAVMGPTAYASDKEVAGASDASVRRDEVILNRANEADGLNYDTAWSSGLTSKGRLIL